MHSGIILEFFEKYKCLGIFAFISDILGSGS